MSCCCTSIYNGGCINSCDGYTLAGFEGESVTVTIENSGRTWEETVTVQEGGSITITALNETGVHIIKFESPVEIEGETYDCIQVTTKIYTEQ
jgi:hypothetical protein